MNGGRQFAIRNRPCPSLRMMVAISGTHGWFFPGSDFSLVLPIETRKTKQGEVPAPWENCVEMGACRTASVPSRSVLTSGGFATTATAYGTVPKFTGGTMEMECAGGLIGNRSAPVSPHAFYHAGNDRNNPEILLGVTSESIPDGDELAFQKDPDLAADPRRAPSGSAARARAARVRVAVPGSLFPVGGPEMEGLLAGGEPNPAEIRLGYPFLLLAVRSWETTGGPGESRTPDQRFRKPLLYPSELQAPGFLFLPD
jgi:hypothetical protein